MGRIALNDERGERGTHKLHFYGATARSLREALLRKGSNPESVPIKAAAGGDTEESWPRSGDLVLEKIRGKRGTIGRHA